MANEEHVLSNHEFEVLKLIDRNLTNKEIAQRLQCPIQEITNRVHHILEKLNVDNRHMAVQWLRKLVANRAR